MELSALPELGVVISFPMIGGFSTTTQHQHFLKHFFFWDPYNSIVSLFNIVPEISETLQFFHSFIFSSAVILSFYSFQLTYLLFSVISYWFILEHFSFSNCVVHCCLFFISSKFPLKYVKCFFHFLSILFSKFWNFFTAITLNSFSVAVVYFLSYLFVLYTLTFAPSSVAFFFSVIFFIYFWWVGLFLTY